MRKSPQAIGVAGRLCSISEISPSGEEEERDGGEVCGREEGRANKEGEEKRLKDGGGWIREGGSIRRRGRKREKRVCACVWCVHHCGMFSYTSVCCTYSDGNLVEQ
jgi:hypothetical protein